MLVIDVASQSIRNIGQGASPPEIYEELWVYSGNGAGISSPSITPGGTNSFLQRGNLGLYSASQVLFTLNSSQSVSTKFAFESSLEISASGYTTYAELWDITSGLAVPSSQISSTSVGTMIITRSGQFTLTPGHQYGITVWVSNATGHPGITDASLVVFP